MVNQNHMKLVRGGKRNQHWADISSTVSNLSKKLEAYLGKSSKNPALRCQHERTRERSAEPQGTRVTAVNDVRNVHISITNGCRHPGGEGMYVSGVGAEMGG